MNLFELGQTLKRARIRHSLTQQDLATHAGVSLSTVSGLERGTLSEIGIVKLVQLFSAVELELRPIPVGQRRTLDDIQAENSQRMSAGQAGSPKLNEQKSRTTQQTVRQRVRRTQKEDKR